MSQSFPVSPKSSSLDGACKSHPRAMVRKKIPAAQKGQRIVVSDEGVLLLEDIFRWNQRNHEDHEERLTGIKEMKRIGQTPINQFSPSFMISMLFMVKILIRS
jgi:hypothetical protein